LRDQAQIVAQFGRNVAEARGWTGLTQQELAERIAMNSGHISKIENGKWCPGLGTLYKLADGLEVSVADLLYGID
jgi:ribosome-binding protein aMBF1 (putative translation factor)